MAEKESANCFLKLLRLYLIFSEEGLVLQWCQVDVKQTHQVLQIQGPVQKNTETIALKVSYLSNTNFKREMLMNKKYYFCTLEDKHK